MIISLRKLFMLGVSRDLQRLCHTAARLF